MDDENTKKDSISLVDTEKVTSEPTDTPTFKFKRRHYLRLLDKKFQFKVIVLVFLLIVFSHLVFALFTYHDVNSTGKLLSYMVPEVAKGINDLKAQIILNMCVTLITSLAVVIILSLYFTNKVSGPLYNMTRVMRKLSMGDFNQFVRIRKKDELRTFANEMNSMIASLRYRKQELEALKKRLRYKDLNNLPALIADVEETLEKF